MHYTWHLETVWNYREVFYRAALVTAEITARGLFIGVVLGLTLGMMRSTRIVPLRWPAALYNNTYRPLEVYTVLALEFAAIIFPFIYLSQLIERFVKGRS